MYIFLLTFLFFAVLTAFNTLPFHHPFNRVSLQCSAPGCEYILQQAMNILYVHQHDYRLLVLDNHSPNSLTFNNNPGGQARTIFAIDQESQEIRHFRTEISIYGMTYPTLLNTLTHELLHAVYLLDHSNQIGSIMNYSIILDIYGHIENDVSIKHLSFDDYDGILYKLNEDLGSMYYPHL